MHGQKAFGFRWFVPELLKHKHVWRDVLIASLIIQLLALGACSSYFEYRPTGVIAARLHGVENIRELIKRGQGHIVL